MRSDFPLPELDWEPTRGFWQAAQREELVIPRCEACGTYTWYPAARCKCCNSESMPWTPVSGRGTLFSYCVVKRALFPPFAEKAPYVTGLVALDEDPSVRLVTTLVDCDPEHLRMDMPMRVVFRQLDFPDVEAKVIAPHFRPARLD